MRDRLPRVLSRDPSLSREDRGRQGRVSDTGTRSGGIGGPESKGRLLDLVPVVPCVCSPQGPLGPHPTRSAPHSTPSLGPIRGPHDDPTGDLLEDGCGTETPSTGSLRLREPDPIQTFRPQNCVRSAEAKGRRPWAPGGRRVDTLRAQGPPSVRDRGRGGVSVDIPGKPRIFRQQVNCFLSDSWSLP